MYLNVDEFRAKNAELPKIALHPRLRTFVQKTSTTQIFFILWLQSDNELPCRKRKKIGGH